MNKSYREKFMENRLGWRVRAKLVGLCQKDIADSLGVSSNHLSRVISGVCDPSVSYIEKVEDFLSKKEEEYNSK